MTPRIAFALAFAICSGTAAAGDSTNPGLATGGQTTEADALPVVELVAPGQPPETIDLTAEPDELFQRIRRGFAMPNINNSLVLHHQQWFSNRPESLRRMVERSSRYLHHIVEEIEKRGMPMELALLPMVESAYNPTAYSRSHASGLWQFVPATGRQYKLEQSWWLDERRDIVASTAAALEYLQYIYDLHGDWHLALASYNWGEGAVGKAINRNRANGLPTDYLSLTMPEETRHYVPKLQALKNIFSNPNVLASLNIRGVPNRPYFATVTKSADIDVELAARLAEMPVREFVALNPAHNRPVIKSDKPLVIPAHKLDTFVSNLEAHEESEKPLSSWQAYTLRAGEKLEQVAPRFGLTVANLKAVNGISGSIRVTAGQTLLVPLPEGVSPGEQLASLATDAAPPVASEQPRVPAAAVVAQAPRPAQPEPAPAAAISRTHMVRKGETLHALAQRYGMTMAELKQINKLRADQVNIGSKLLVAAAEPTAKPAAQRNAASEADSRPTAAAAGMARTASGSHLVRKGETLSEVASRYDMSVAELKQINKLRADQVNAGTRLLVAAAEPASRPSAGKARNEQDESRREANGNRAASAAVTKGSERAAKEDRNGNRQAEKAGDSSRKPLKLAQYTIRRGDTLGSIARQFRVEKDDLLRWNRIQNNDIKPGQRLTIQLVQNTY
ncbi:LysM peptidoglycan-binding domain-containing protein [Accumulibacter sp.]|uniref:LysM peptidoglycan-binding domain-containing protein n=1 Tax=Accumulibacter sp. TaxID=2053492 RepID=UPI0025D3AB61|nr:LysM peptidoglycan-binding domain-containing protein [Accumulibacter sp.]MCM8611967.1 LysM peptidoglycan-binding domain-containing protein [Accumulibacter sp.]MCM8635589.1 LysM peptidoglycan-binding domain-containing protein [Accumulibacter sp.]MCM8639167.1 LysM peptidoglycan-binding domain-containing protein [Accumulibacter sp.]